MCDLARWGHKSVPDTVAERQVMTGHRDREEREGVLGGRAVAEETSVWGDIWGTAPTMHQAAPGVWWGAISLLMLLPLQKR